MDILPNLSVRIPTVGEILDNEQHYYNLIYSLTATPYQYMVQLDNMGVNFTTVTDYELFMMLFLVFAKGDLSILFGDIDLSDMAVKTNLQNGLPVLYSPQNQITIDEFVYNQIVNVIRKINNLKRENRKPGNESARKYILERERKKQRRNAKKSYEPYLEKLVIALVNTSEFPYDYDSCMDLSIYKFNQSFKQIQHKIAFDKTMIGVYTGTVDISRLGDRSCLSWIPVK